MDIIIKVIFILKRKLKYLLVCAIESSLSLSTSKMASIEFGITVRLQHLISSDFPPPINYITLSDATYGEYQLEITVT